MLAWLLVVLSFTLDRWMQLSQGHPPPPLLVAIDHDADPQLTLGHNISQQSDNILSLFGGFYQRLLILYYI